MASRRNYVTTAEVLALIGSSPTDAEISQAEEMIDGFVGVQDKFIKQPLSRLATGGAVGSLNLNANDCNVYECDYFRWCEVEIIGGTGVGQRTIISASTKAGVLTFQTNMTIAPDSTSFYRIYQLGKFPRCKDVVFYNESSVVKYYKQIPEAIKRAVAYELEYINDLGDDFFTGGSVKKREKFGDYEYENQAGASSVVDLIAPKARAILSGIYNRMGEIVA